MSASEFILDICPICAATLLGFTLEKVAPQVKETKCAFCKKKRHCDIYRVKAEKED